MARGDLVRARALLRAYVAWFGAANVYVELQQNQVRGDTRRVAQLAVEVGVTALVLIALLCGPRVAVQHLPR